MNGVGGQMFSILVRRNGDYSHSGVVLSLDSKQTPAEIVKILHQKAWAQTIGPGYQIPARVVLYTEFGNHIASMPDLLAAGAVYVARNDEAFVYPEAMQTALGSHTRMMEKVERDNNLDTAGNTINVMDQILDLIGSKDPNSAANSEADLASQGGRSPSATSVQSGHSGENRGAAPLRDTGDAALMEYFKQFTMPYVDAETLGGKSEVGGGILQNMGQGAAAAQGAMRGRISPSYNPFNPSTGGLKSEDALRANHPLVQAQQQQQARLGGGLASTSDVMGLSGQGGRGMPGGFNSAAAMGGLSGMPGMPGGGMNGGAQGAAGAQQGGGAGGTTKGMSTRIQSHKLAEARSRQRLKDAFHDLHMSLPALSGHPQPTKAQIVRTAVGYIATLKAALEESEKQKKKAIEAAKEWHAKAQQKGEKGQFADAELASPPGNAIHEPFQLEEFVEQALDDHEIEDQPVQELVAHMSNISFLKQMPLGLMILKDETPVGVEQYDLMKLRFTFVSQWVCMITGRSMEQLCSHPWATLIKANNDTDGSLERAAAHFEYCMKYQKTYYGVHLWRSSTGDYYAFFLALMPAAFEEGNSNVQAFDWEKHKRSVPRYWIYRQSGFVMVDPKILPLIQKAVIHRGFKFMKKYGLQGHTPDTGSVADTSPPTSLGSGSSPMEWKSKPGI
eukprot:Clim_evm9s206 gene=Clim_evmTU9s206